MSNNLFLQNLLTANNLHLDQQLHSVDAAGATIAESSNEFIAVLTHYGFISIEGPDTVKFLQGQSTCDVMRVTEKQSCNGAFCNPKGRMISSFQLALTSNEHYLLRLSRSLVANTRTVLGKYIVFSKAQQQDASDDFIAIGLAGKNSRAIVQAKFGTCPTEQFGSVVHNGNVIIQMDHNGCMFECWILSSQLGALWPDLSANLEILGSRSWELLTIREGLGEVTVETQEMFIPQMLNYQITGAVNFTKGCYTGQEVVARMEYRGKLKRPMYRIKTASGALLPGDELYNPTGEQSIGNIVNSVPLDDCHSEALAVITSKDVEMGCVVVGKEKAVVEILSLPYELKK